MNHVPTKLGLILLFAPILLGAGIAQVSAQVELRKERSDSQMRVVRVAPAPTAFQIERWNLEADSFIDRGRQDVPGTAQ